MCVFSNPKGSVFRKRRTELTGLLRTDLDTV